MNQVTPRLTEYTVRHKSTGKLHGVMAYGAIQAVIEVMSWYAGETADMSQVECDWVQNEDTGYSYHVEGIKIVSTLLES